MKALNIRKISCPLGRVEDHLEKGYGVTPACLFKSGGPLIEWVVTIHGGDRLMAHIALSTDKRGGMVEKSILEQGDFRGSTGIIVHGGRIMKPSEEGETSEIRFTRLGSTTEDAAERTVKELIHWIGAHLTLEGVDAADFTCLSGHRSRPATMITRCGLVLDTAKTFGLDTIDVSASAIDVSGDIRPVTLYAGKAKEEGRCGIISISPFSGGIRGQIVCDALIYAVHSLAINAYGTGEGFLAVVDTRDHGRALYESNLMTGYLGRVDGVEDISSVFSLGDRRVVVQRVSGQVEVRSTTTWIEIDTTGLASLPRGRVIKAFKQTDGGTTLVLDCEGEADGGYAVCPTEIPWAV